MVALTVTGFVLALGIVSIPPPDGPLVLVPVVVVVRVVARDVDGSLEAAFFPSPQPVATVVARSTAISGWIQRAGTGSRYPNVQDCTPNTADLKTNALWSLACW